MAIDAWSVSGITFSDWPPGIQCDLDLNRAGKGFGTFTIPRVPATDADEPARFPIAVFNHGDGPRILIMGGVHGDEFEGQLLAADLLRDLDIDNVQGSIIILPATNAPAAFAGQHASPIDDGDLNRSYPGSPDGTTTQRLAHLMATTLLPRVEYLLDFHSGGIGSYVIPSAHVYHHADPATFAKLKAMLEVFGMPYSTILKGLSDHEKKAIGTCDRLGVLRFASELGGGGYLTPDVLAQAKAGLRRLLHFLGALRRQMTDEPAPLTQFIRRLPNAKYVHTEVGGIFEPLVDIGDPIVAGQPAARIHSQAEPWQVPHVVHFPESGFVHSRRTLSHVRPGDKLYMVHVPFEA